MHDNHGFLWFHQIPFLAGLPIHVVSALFVGVMLIAVTWIARLQLKRSMQSVDGGLVPAPRWTFLNFFEIMAEKLYSFAEGILGEHQTKRFYPFIGSLFLFIFISNLLGLLPGFRPPTDDLNTTVALGTIVFVYYNYLGFKENGMAYLKHFMGPVWWIAPMIFLIEVISHFVRPISLGLRLRGNIFGDHMVLSVFSELTPYIVPTIFYGLGAFVCFIQAFVFTILTMVYISLSTAHDH
ncbi:MAG: F0F1 ATP synthase subunit A [Bacteriovoracia bacterium]